MVCGLSFESRGCEVGEMGGREGEYKECKRKRADQGTKGGGIRIPVMSHRAQAQDD